MALNRRLLKRGLLAIVAVLIGIQLIPVWLVQTNPPVRAEPAWDSPRTRTLMQRACLDCHSNQTTWPLYSRIAPVSWLVTLDVIRGRRHLNVSEWGTGQAQSRESDENASAGSMAEVIRDGSMPPDIYTVLHPEARLSAVEQQQLIDGIMATFK